jgi:hypothetical protein
MAKNVDSKRETETRLPSKGFAFLVGLFLFGLILCPGAVFIFYNLKLHWTYPITQLQGLTLGCISGLVIAAIPAFFFMHMVMKRVRNY